ncbi:MAG: hypothetical protein K0S04_1177 [Herbinix sp.]|jgi:hypothetical protein|nr:hypothetical protein [Herbinix sp.]
MENSFEYRRELDALRFTSEQKALMISQLKSSFEKESQEVHHPTGRIVERSLDTQILKKTERRVMKIRFTIVLAAVITALGVSTAAAAYILQWNGKLAEKFGATEQQQKKLVENGALDSPDQTVTENGVTITAIQTLGDKNGLYVLFDVKAPEGIELTKDGSGISTDVKIEGVKHVSWNAQFVLDNEKTVSPSGAANERYYELWLDNTEEEDWNGKTITVEFSDLRDLNKGVNDNISVTGKWNLSWKLSYMNQMQTYDINKTYMINGHEVIVKFVEISPLSMTLKLSGSGLEQLVANSDLNKAGGLCSVSLMMKVGTTVEEGPRNESYSDNTYTQVTRFGQVQDMDQLTGYVLTFYHETTDNTITVTLP